MADSTKNVNITSLSMSGSPGIGTNYSLSMTGQSISSEIARKNLALVKKTDRRVDRLYDDVFNLVSSYSSAEKQAILREYGELESLRSTSKHELDVKTTECLIIHLSDKEIDALLAQIRLKNIRVKNMLVRGENLREKSTSAATKSLMKNLSGFNTSTFQKTFESIKKYNAIGAVQAAKRIDPSYKIGKRYVSKYNKLYTEIMREVLPYYNKIELVSLATRMGIEVFDGKDQKQLKTEIATKVILYVHLIVGRSRNANLGGMILDPTAYDEILMLTSYAFVTGKPGIDPNELAERRKNMQNAKKAIQVKMNAKRRASIINPRTRSTMRKIGGSITKIMKGEDSLLGDLSESELYNMATNFGLDVKKYKTMAGLRVAIYERIIADEKQRRRYLAQSERGIKKPWKREELRRKADMVSGGETAQLRSRLFEKQSTTSSGTPLVRLDKSGNSIEADISSAVPVIIVGAVRGGENDTIKQGIKDAIAKENGYLEDNWKRYSWREKRKFRYKELGTSAGRDALRERYGISSNQFDIRTRMSGVDTSLPSMVPTVNFNTNSSFDDIINIVTKVVPVFVVNNGNPVNNTNTGNKFTQGIGGNAQRVSDYLLGVFANGKNRIPFTKDGTTITQELASLGYSPTSAILGKGNATPGKQYVLTDTDLDWAIQNKYRFYKGGRLSYKGTQSIITGDAPGSNIFAGGARPELITFGNGEAQIKPLNKVNKFAKGGTISDEGAVKDLSETERKSALNVAMTSPSVYFSKKIPGVKSEVKESGIGSALKVVDVSYSFLKDSPVNRILESIEDMKDSQENIASALSNLLTGLSIPAIVAAPMGVGTIAFPGLAAAKVLQTATEITGTAANATMKALTDISASSGARITRFAGGGTAAITGDASGRNIFAKGAKPELVQSNGDLKVSPLNPALGQTREKVNRMTSAERNSALATSLASHIIKYSYPLGEGVNEISNSGEAIKVYNIKPGIADKVDVGGASVSLIELVAAISAQLEAMGVSSESQTQLLGTIAAKTTSMATNVATIGANSNNNGDVNPFATGFPSSLDSVLSGL